MKKEIRLRTLFFGIHLSNGRREKMINKQLELIIEKYKITKTQNIIYGTNIPMPNMIIPTGRKTFIRFDETEKYFFYFDEKGITIYSFDGEDYAKIDWSEVKDFKVKHVSILGKMTVQTKENTYKFQLNRFVIGCPFIKINTRYLEENHYFYQK